MLAGIIQEVSKKLNVNIQLEKSFKKLVSFKNKDIKSNLIANCRKNRKKNCTNFKMGRPTYKYIIFNRG